MDHSSPLLTAALTYHVFGWPVIPVGPDKRPLCKWRQWSDRAQTDAEVRAMPWNRAHGLALLTSPGSELVVLDFDGPHAMTAWETTGIALPDTAQTKTRSGGQHFIYKFPNGAPTPAFNGNAVDLHRRVRLVRAEGCGCTKSCGVDLLLKGYFIVPPTPGYAGNPDLPLEPGRVAAIPQAILDLARGQKASPGGPEASTDNWVLNALRGAIPEGERNATAARLAGYFLPKLGNDVDEVLALLQPWAGTVCSPPMDPRELRKLRDTVESIARLEASRTKTQRPGKNPPPETNLLDFARGIPLFHDRHQDGHAIIPVSGHQETHRIRDRAFKHWLTKQYYDATAKAPSAEKLNNALNVLEAVARYKGSQQQVNLRVAQRHQTFYYDLADSECRAVELDEHGWRLVPAAPLFRRAANTAAQVTALAGGKVERVLEFVNLTPGDQHILLLVYLVACLVPGIPHPVLVLSGPQGAAKSSTTRIIRRLVDPAVEELLSLPTDPNELALALAGNYVLAIDNLDGLSPWQSDMLARAVTGGGISKRRLYTDDEEVILRFHRCILLNGINSAATRPDLLDRTIALTLERVPPERRREEADVRAAFEAARAEIFGGMLDALVHAQVIYPTVQLSALPRMADFCRWGYAIAEGLGIGGWRFLEAYWRSIGESNEAAIQAHSVAAAVVALVADKTEWAGTPSDLLTALEKVAQDERIDIRAMAWPKAAHALTKRLREVTTNLRDAGVDVTLDGRTGKRRQIILRRSTENSVTAVTSVTAQPALAFSSDAKCDDISRVPGSVIGSDTGGRSQDQGALPRGSQIDDASDAPFPQPSDRDASDSGTNLEEVEL